MGILTKIHVKYKELLQAINEIKRVTKKIYEVEGIVEVEKLFTEEEQLFTFREKYNLVNAPTPTEKTEVQEHWSRLTPCEQPG